MTNLTPRALLCDLMDELDAKDGLSRNARAQRAFARRRLGTPLEDIAFKRACDAQKHVPAKAQTWPVDQAPQEDNSPGNIYLEALRAKPVNPWLMNPVNNLMFDCGKSPWLDVGVYKPSPEKPMKESDYNNMLLAQNTENRIRANREARVAPAADLTPIDTSTTAGKIAVMQAHVAGHPVQTRPTCLHNESDWIQVGKEPFWNFEINDYRIAPPPAPEPPQTALQAARERARKMPPTGGDADNSVRDLLKQIDASPLVTVSGDSYVKQVHFGLGVMQPGRYRLVRDDE